MDFVERQLEKEREREAQKEEKEKEREFQLQREEKEREFQLQREEKEREFQLQREEKEREFQLQREEKEREFQLQREERDRESQKELMIIQHKQMLELKDHEGNGSTPSNVNVTQAVKLKMPYFDERHDDLDTYLTRFERLGEYRSGRKTLGVLGWERCSEGRPWKFIMDWWTMKPLVMRL